MQQSEPNSFRLPRIVIKIIVYGTLISPCAFALSFAGNQSNAITGGKAITIVSDIPNITADMMHNLPNSNYEEVLAVHTHSFLQNILVYIQKCSQLD